MTEIEATIENLAAQLDALKMRSGRMLTNMFQSNGELADMLTRKACRLFYGHKALLLSIPYFQHYRDLFYCVATTDALYQAVKEAQAARPDGVTLRISVVGRDTDTQATLAALTAADFACRARNARMRLEKPKPHIIAALRELVASQDDGTTSQPRFATQEDAEAVYRLLSEEFDFCSDSLPEFEELVDNIAKKQVVVICDADTVVCAHYFTLSNNIYYGHFDVTAKAYRHKFLFLRITLFMYDNVEMRGTRSFVRRYGWRNVAAKRLVKFAKLSNQISDGIYINNMVWPASEGEQAHAAS